MATCSVCQQPIIRVIHDGKPLVLDPRYRVYAAVDDAHAVVPQDGDRVFCSTALVEHGAVCEGTKRQAAKSEREAPRGGAHNTAPQGSCTAEKSTR